MNKRPKVLILAMVAAIGTVLNTVLLIITLTILRHEIATHNAQSAMPMPQAFAGPLPELEKYNAALKKFKAAHPDPPPYDPWAWKPARVTP